MSALAHKLEAKGIATVALALVRAQAEKTRPPRALWTSAPLGRPLGEPGDRDFQLRLLRHALKLLERTDGPVILEDYPEDPPSLTDAPGWMPPATTAATFAEELAEVMPLWLEARHRFGRSSVGLSLQSPEAWPEFVADVLAGGLPVVPGLDTCALSVRFLCDDIKAYYGEVAQAVGPPPSHMQVDTWFWRSTRAADALRALRTVAMASGNNALKTVGGRFFVPTPWVT